LNLASRDTHQLNWLLSAGMEWQRGNSTIQNYDNNGGVQGSEQASDALKSGQHFYFVRIASNWNKRLFVELATSLNYYNYAFRELFPTKENDYSSVNFTGEWMPRVAANYLITENINVRGSIG